MGELDVFSKCTQDLPVPRFGSVGSGKTSAKNVCHFVRAPKGTNFTATKF